MNLYINTDCGGGYMYQFLSCIQQLQELTGIGQSVRPSVSLRVTLFCHNLNLRIDLRIDPANQKWPQD